MKNKILNKLINKNYFFHTIGKVLLKSFSFCKINRLAINAHWGILISTTKVNVPLSKVFVIVHSTNGYSKIKIEDSPHFNYINNLINKHSEPDQFYKEYINKYYPEIDYENKKKNFLDLYKNILQNQDQLFICFKKEANIFINKEFKVIDGLHRVSIAKALGINNIHGYIIDSINN
jgi:predicted transport protein